MNTDNEIKSIFSNYNPELGDSAAFMDALERRLDMVEDIRRCNRADIRRYWTGSIVAFISGIAIGAFALIVVIFRPASLTQLRLAIEGVFLRFFAFRMEFLALAILVAAVLVIVPLIRTKVHSAISVR